MQTKITNFTTGTNERTNTDSSE